ncbi:MAG TPA: hypothetical protein VN370_10555, partial [Desulfitobacteriaceae bacterium]|nr:hypothetical protein [Desulfitobacteriaceae bacterium]
MSQVKTDKSTKSIATTKKVFPMVKEYYTEANKVVQDHSKKIAYITGAGIVDLAWVYESVFPVFPENFNAACAAKQMTPPLLQVAEGAGYARELCGYFRNHTGYLLEGKDWQDVSYPGGGLPAPDLLLGDSSTCYFHLKWWRETERL